MELKDKLEKLRREKGLKDLNRDYTQKEISKKLHIGYTTYKNYESGRIPETNIIKRIRDFYNVSYEYLLDDDCLNKTNENISINKLLGFSDITTDKIKKVNENKRQGSIFKSII